MNGKYHVDEMYTPDSGSAHGEDIINMITYLNKFSGMEHFMNIGYADSMFEYFFYPLGLSSKRLPERLARPLMDRPDGKGTILVAGCGRGGEAVLLHELTGRPIMGVDITQFNIETAQRYAKKKNLIDDVSFVLGDACGLPVASESVSCVFSCESAFHYGDKKSFIRESYRVLKKGGYVLIADIVGKLPREMLAEDESRLLGEFGRMLAAGEFYTMELYKSQIEDAGFSEIIDSEVITEHNLDFMARGSSILVKLYSMANKVPGLKNWLRHICLERNIDLENFIEHSRTTREAVNSELVDYIIISAEK